jgi:hypothetical protein
LTNFDKCHSPTEGTTTYERNTLTARAPHINATGDPHPIFVQYNHKLWNILQDICADTEAWTWIKKHSSCSRNGRRADFTLYDQYLGATGSDADTIQNEARGKLEKTKYTGEKRNFNFEKYVAIYKKSHDAITRLTEYGYPGIDKHEKVQEEPRCNY